MSSEYRYLIIVSDGKLKKVLLGVFNTLVLLVSMGKRKKTELLAAYVYPETLEKADGLVDELFAAKLIEVKNRSELVRFCLLFMLDFMSRKPNIEFLKTVKDYLVLEGIEDTDSLGAFASLSSEFLTNKILDNVPRIIL